MTRFVGTPSDRARPGSVQAHLTVYGTSWCAQTMLVRRFLERHGVPYRYVDIEADAGALARLRWWTGGRASHPTVTVGGLVLVEPSLRELGRLLERLGRG